MLSYLRNLWERHASARSCRRLYPAVEAVCRSLHSREPIYGLTLCAEEAERWVVRVYYGNREMSEYMGPPWRDWFAVGIDKLSGSTEVIADADKYRPIIR